MRVEVFSDEKPNELKRQINEWMASTNATVHFVRQSECGSKYGGRITITIFYTPYHEVS